MEQKDLVKKLEGIGFKFDRHDIYVRGKDSESIPRHKEINEHLAIAILKKWGL